MVIEDINRRDFVKSTLAAAGSGVLAAPADVFAQRVSRPNILIFVADDAGAKDFGCYGNTTIKTPNIDRLAEKGVVADNAMLTTSQCSPSRISILTGLYPHATGAEDLGMPMPPDKRTIPYYLKHQGYFSGHMQKRHEGPYSDAQFDWYNEGLDRFDAFLDASGERPFFLWVAFEDPHRPYAAEGILEEPHDPNDLKLPPYLADTQATREERAKYYDEIARLDSVIGRFMKMLQNRGMQHDTLVVFISDNGAPFPREKGTLYDTGVRTPLIFHWPGVVPTNSRNRNLISIIDLAPTLLSFAGVAVPSQMQGRDITEGVLDPDLALRDAAFSERNWHDCDEHMRSVRTPGYRLIVNAYISLPFCTPGDVSKSPSWRALYRRKDEEDALRPMQARLFQTPRPKIEFYELQSDPWELNNLAGNSDYDEPIMKHYALLSDWMRTTNDFSPEKRKRFDNVDRVTGVQFNKIDWYSINAK